MRLLEKVRSLGSADSKGKFYHEARLQRVEWWYSWCHPHPDLFFARLRVYSNGAADVRFQDEAKVFGFVNEDSAANFIGEDEFSRLCRLDDEDREFLEIPDDAVIDAPHWKDPDDLGFEYVGEY